MGKQVRSQQKELLRQFATFIEERPHPLVFVGFGVTWLLILMLVFKPRYITGSDQSLTISVFILLFASCATGITVYFLSLKRSNKNLKRELSETRQSNKRLLKQIPDALIEIDPDQHILLFSREATALLGYHSNYIENSNFKELLSEEFHDEFNSFIESASLEDTIEVGMLHRNSSVTKIVLEIVATPQALCETFLLRLHNPQQVTVKESQSTEEKFFLAAEGANEGI